MDYLERVKLQRAAAAQRKRETEASEAVVRELKAVQALLAQLIASNKGKD